MGEFFRGSKSIGSWIWHSARSKETYPRFPTAGVVPDAFTPDAGRGANRVVGRSTSVAASRIRRLWAGLLLRTSTGSWCPRDGSVRCSSSLLCGEHTILLVFRTEFGAVQLAFIIYDCETTSEPFIAAIGNRKKIELEARPRIFGGSPCF
jgi:hypothetical protein